METLIKFKIKNKDLVITLNNEADFEDVLVELVEKLQEAKKLFRNEKINILFSGRDLSDDEEEAIYAAIEQSSLNIVVYANEAYIEHYAEPAVEPNLEPVAKPSLTFSDEEVREKSKDLQEEYDPQRQPAFFQNGSLRSGRRIEFDGSVVLLGDLNAGAEIVATGNIVILGACRGMVHAGSRGDTNTYIFAQQLRPTQIRIAEMVTYLNIDKNDVVVPSYAYTEENKIYVAKI